MAVIINGTTGITSPEPFVLTSGTLSSPAVAGQTEYDGKVFYQTPQSTERGVVPGAQFFRLNSGLAGANVNTAQSVFGVGVTLSASTVYAFEAEYVFTKTAGTTAHTFGLGFAGTATVNNLLYTSLNYFTNAALNSPLNTASIAITYCSINQTANTSGVGSTSASATQTQTFKLKGTISVNAGGTLIPQYTLSAAPGGAYTTAAGSYFMIYPIGASGANTSVGTWA
jgi:hypothetical protein